MGLRCTVSDDGYDITIQGSLSFKPQSVMACVSRDDGHDDKLSVACRGTTVKGQMRMAASIPVGQNVTLTITRSDGSEEFLYCDARRGECVSCEPEEPSSPTGKALPCNHRSGTCSLPGASGTGRG